MAGNKEMISTTAPIPIRIFISNDTNIIGNHSMHMIPRISDKWTIEKLNDLGDSDRNKKNMGLIRMTSHETAFATLHLVDELALDAVDASDRAIME